MKWFQKLAKTDSVLIGTVTDILENMAALYNVGRLAVDMTEEQLAVLIEAMNERHHREFKGTPARRSRCRLPSGLRGTLSKQL